MSVFVEPQRTLPLTEQLYQAAREATAYYIDDGSNMTERVTVFVAENSLEAETLPSAEPLPPNESFNKEQTRFLIDLIRSQLQADGIGLPRTFKELNYRLKSAKGQKKNLWLDIANKLSKHFMETFDPNKVARKWYTLEDGYKKVLEHNSTSSQIKTRFQFFNEMEELLDGHHDLDIPAVGTVQGIVGRRRKTWSIDCQRDSPAARQTSTRPPSPTQPLRKRRRTEEDYSTLLDFLRESEAASQRRHEEILAQMKSAQKGFEELMCKFLEKM